MIYLASWTDGWLILPERLAEAEPTPIALSLRQPARSLSSITQCTPQACDNDQCSLRNCHHVACCFGKTILVDGLPLSARLGVAILG